MMGKEAVPSRAVIKKEGLPCYITVSFLAGVCWNNSATCLACFRGIFAEVGPN